MRRAWFAVCLLAYGCGSTFDPSSRVTDFRLVAVQADKPFAAPGEAVALRTLAVEPFGRAVTWAWGTCDKPEDTTAVGCLKKVVEDAKKSGNPPPFTMGQGMDTFTLDIASTALDGISPAARANATIGVVTVACPGALSLKDVNALTDGELPFRCLDGNTHEELSYDRYAVAVKRIFLRTKDKKQNPTIADVQWDGASWAETDVKAVAPCTNDVNTFADCAGGEAHDVASTIGPGAPETGVDELGVPFTEEVVFQYYATGGIFKFDARTIDSPTTRWSARASDAGKTLTFWFVVRDNRGGVGWISRQVRVLGAATR